MILEPKDAKLSANHDVIHIKEFHAAFSAIPNIVNQTFAVFHKLGGF